MARWTPLYDVRAFNKDSSVQVGDEGFCFSLSLGNTCMKFSLKIASFVIYHNDVMYGNNLRNAPQFKTSTKMFW